MADVAFAEDLGVFALVFAAGFFFIFALAVFALVLLLTEAFFLADTEDFGLGFDVEEALVG
ncbi:MAG: hypothetical protein NPIRA05_22900 [Nitrospirales bacterium]|nr:MAG: hypothetical protein NPIRA05_22900 [Nitrospirales bacterium]